MNNYDAIAHAISLEMCVPIDFSTKVKAYSGKAHIESALVTLKAFEFSRIVDDANIDKAVTHGVFYCMSNTGQSCNAATRMLVPASKYQQAVRVAKLLQQK